MEPENINADNKSDNGKTGQRLAPILRWSSISSSMEGGSSSNISTSSPCKSPYNSSSGIVPDDINDDNISNNKLNHNENIESDVENDDNITASENQPLFNSTSTAISISSNRSSTRPNSVNDHGEQNNKSPDSNGDVITVVQNQNNKNELKNQQLSNNNNKNVVHNEKFENNSTNDGVKFDVPGKEKDDSIVSSVESFIDEDEEEKPKVPDGGWGWMIVFSSFIISMVADGISFSFGLLYIRFLRYFKESKSVTSWIGSLFMAVPLIAGPICSALVDRFGCRKMTIIGGLIATFGFFLSSFSETILMMYMTFGFLSGLGLGLCYVTAVVSIAYWFDKKRSLATGLGACGTGIGTIFYAPMTQFFIDYYGWRGTVMLLSGTFLNMCVCGALMRDPEWWIEEQKQSLAKSRVSSSCASLVTAADVQALEEIRELIKSGQSPDYILTQLATAVAKSPIPTIPEDEVLDKASKTNVQSVYNLPTYIRQNEKVPLEVLASLRHNKRMFNIILDNYPTLLACRSISDNGKLHLIDKEPTTQIIQNRIPVTMRVTTKSASNNKDLINGSSVTSPLLQQPTTTDVTTSKQAKESSPPKPSHDALKKKQSILDNHHYLKNIRVHRNSVMYRVALLNTHRYRLRASSCPDIYRNSMTTLAKETEESWKTELKEIILNICDFSMFLELHFFLLSVGTIMLFTWFIVPYFYLADYMTEHNYTEQEASNVLSIIGFTNTIGMVGLGWLGDQPWINVSWAYAICLIGCGISTFGMPLFGDHYWLLVTSAALWGLFFASNFSYTPPLIVELIPLDKFSTAYGLILLCQGIGNLLGPPLAGYIYDVTGLWDYSFYLAGFWILLSGILILIIPITNNRVIYGSRTLTKDKDSIA